MPSKSFRLDISGGASSPRTVSIDQLPFSIGSRRSCALVLKGDGVAPLCGFLRDEEGGLVYHPEGGASPRPLAEGEALEVGPFRLVLTAEAAPDPPATTPAQQLLSTLIELAPQVWEGAPGPGLFEALLGGLARLFEAHWAAILVLREGQAEAEVLHSVGQRSGPAAASTTVLAALQARDAPIMTSDIRADPQLADAASLQVSVRSVIAARLGGRGGRTEVVYLEGPGAGRGYGEAERELLAGFVALTGGMLTRARAARDAEGRSRRLTQLHQVQMSEAPAGSELVGTSRGMDEVRAQIRQANSTGSTALVLGESGTGKELVARALHLGSARRDQPFVAVNCMALNPELVESELFGHVKGAFSGAAAARPGRFELAHGGTLFLDELGELSLAVQVKLLRVLEERVVQRVGDSRERPVDLRLVAATNADLPAAIREGRFREDLYYRLSVFSIRLPPLRDRLEDIPLLAQHLVQRFNREFGRAVRGFSPAAMARLQAYAWPGNVRELRNVVEQAFARDPGDELGEAALALPAQPAAAATGGGVQVFPDCLEMARATFERQHLTRILTEEAGDTKAAAARLEVSRGNLYKRCTQHGLDPKSFRS